MGVEIPVGFGQATFVYTCTGIVDEVNWTLGVAPNGGSFDSTWASDIYTAFTASLRPCNAAQMTGAWTFQGVDVSFETDTGPILQQHRVPITGTKTGTSPPPNVAVLCKKNTALGGRKNRGRMFLPPANLVVADVSAAGLILTATLNILQAQITDAITAMNTAGIAPRLLHSSLADTPTPITSFSLASLIATQRRRIR